MAGNASRRGAVDMGMVLMVVAFAVIGGFLFWLSGQAAREREMAVVVDTTTEEPEDNVRTVTAEEIQMDAAPFEGQEIRLASFTVASPLGTQGFWLEMPNGNPFLVSMSSEVMAEGTTVQSSNRVTVSGTVHAMSDSVLTAWTEAGTIAEGDRVVAEFATHYLEADRVQVSGGGGASDDGN